MEDKEYLLKVQIKNNKLILLMKKAGISSIAELIRESGCGVAAHDVANLKISAFNKNGELNATVAKLADFFNVTPQDLFPAKNFTDPLDKNTSEREVSIEDIEQTMLVSASDPLLLLEYKEREADIKKALSLLPKRTADIVERTVLGDETCVQLAQEYGISISRAQQIRERGLRLLKKPSFGLTKYKKEIENG